MAKNGLQYALELIDKSFGVGIRKAKEQTQHLDKEVNKTNDSVKMLGKGFLAAFSINKLIGFSSKLAKITATTEKLNTSMTLNAGKEAEKNIAFINDAVRQLKINLPAAEQGFELMNKKLLTTGIGAENIRNIFEAVGVTALVNRSGAAELESMLKSFGSLGEKGIIKLSDFQNEIGSKIPGAMKIASNAMGVTETKLGQMFESGKISANTFLPAFAQQLKNTFEKGVPEALDGMNAAIENKLNAATGFKRALAKMFEGGIKEGYNAIASMLNWFENLIPLLEPVKTAFVGLFTALNPLWQGLKKIFDAFGTTSGSIEGFVNVINIASGIIEVLATGFGVMLEVLAPLAPWITGIIALQWAWNVAMSANPIGVVVMAIAALIGGITLAYQKIGWFRGAIDAAWSAIKGFGSAIKDYVVDRFKELLAGITGIGSALLKFFKGDWKGAWEEGKKATQNLFGLNSKVKLVNDLKNAGKEAGKAYQNGVSEAQANKKKESKASVTANEKFGLDAVSTTTAANNTKTATPQVSGLTASGGRTEKHTTFNIQSFIKEMKIITTGTDQDIERIKKMLLDTFDEAAADLMIRANE